MIINLLDLIRPKHFNIEILEWDLFAQLQIGPTF